MVVGDARRLVTRITSENSTFWHVKISAPQPATQTANWRCACRGGFRRRKRLWRLAPVCPDGAFSTVKGWVALRRQRHGDRQRTSEKMKYLADCGLYRRARHDSALASTGERY